MKLYFTVTRKAAAAVFAAFLLLILLAGDILAVSGIKADADTHKDRMELIANMVQNGAITFGTAFEYMNENNDFRDLDEFTRILDIWMEKGGKTDE